MKKVALFYKTFSTYGGQEKVVYNFAHFLAEKGYRVEVYAYKVKASPELPGVVVKKVFIPNLGRAFRNLSFALRSYFIARRLKEEGYIIVGFGKTFYQDLFRAGGGVHKYYVERAKYKYVSEVGRRLYSLRKKLLPSYWITSFIEKLTFESSHLKAVIVPTDFVKGQILKFYSPKARLVVIRNGVDLERFSPTKRYLGKELRKELGIPEGVFVFSYVSTNFELKGFQYLLKACEILRRKGLNFKLIAAGEEGNRWRREVERRGLKDTVYLLGRIKEVERVYLAGDFFVYPTLFDASSNAVLEAMACGIPVIASRYSGTGELVVNGVSGFLVDSPENPQEIARKMELALKSPFREMGSSARREVEKYPQERVFEEYEKLLRSLY